jgi:hypothetical protein
MQSIFCNNCGKSGHLFHQCKHPITSNGIVLFRKKEANEPTFSQYLWNLSLSIDQTLNVCLQFILNDFLKYPQGVKFGNPDETISGVMGKNIKTNTLTWFGKFMNWFLDKLQKDHTIKAIETDE